MRTASSASRTCRAEESASEYTAIVRMPMRRAVRKMRQAISPRLATRRLRIIFIVVLPSPLHAEEAEARLFLRRVVHRGKRETENAARLERIDHPVVPESRRGVIGMTLALVLLADGPLEGFLFFRRPVASGALELSALDGREHARRLLAAHDGDAGVGPLKE